MELYTMIVSTAERRLLVTNTDRDLLEFIINVATDTLGISIRQVIPGGPTDDDIVQFAFLNSWDFAFLIVNIIRDPEEDTIPSGALKLISNLGRFNKPIIDPMGGLLPITLSMIYSPRVLPQPSGSLGAPALSPRHFAPRWMERHQTTMLDVMTDV